MKKDFWIALREWNDNRGRRSYISYDYIASSLGISRQALNQLALRRNNKGIGKYKERLKEFLPDDLYENIDFSKSLTEKYGKKKEWGKEKECFSFEDKGRIEKVKWILSKRMYDKIMANDLFTEQRRKNIMNKVKEAEEWEKQKSEFIGAKNEIV